MCVIRISLGLMNNAGILLASSRKLTFGAPVIAVNKAVLMNVQSPHKWWSTLTSAVFGTSLSLPPLVVRVVDWCECLLVRLICRLIILTASSPGRLFTCRSLAIRLL